MILYDAIQDVLATLPDLKGECRDTLRDALDLHVEATDRVWRGLIHHCDRTKHICAIVTEVERYNAKQTLISWRYIQNLHPDRRAFLDPTEIVPAEIAKILSSRERLDLHRIISDAIQLRVALTKPRSAS